MTSPYSISGIEIEFRPLESGDFNFILNSWMQSYRECRPLMSNPRYYISQQRLISGLSRTTMILVACDKANPGFIIGYACGRKLCGPDGPQLLLHYVYVKDNYRRSGLMRKMLEQLGWEAGMHTLVSHWRYNCRNFASKFNMEHAPDVLEIGGTEWVALKENM